MSDLSIRTFSGANPTTTTRITPPGPATVQQAVAQPLLNSQAAVVQAPTAATVQARNPHNDESNIRQQGSTGQQASTETPPTREELAETVNYLNRFLQRFDTALQFDIDPHYGEMVIRIVDCQNKEVIRQIPSEETLAFAKFFKDLEEHSPALPDAGSASTDGLHLKLEGLLLDTRV